MRNEFEGAKVLITGGLGFIGSNLARRLAGLGADLTLVDSLIPEYGGNPFNIEGFRDQVHVNISDVRDTYSLEPLVRGKDYLFNLAGQTSHLDSMLNPVPDLGNQLPGAALDPRGLSRLQSSDQDSLRQHAADLRPADCLPVSEAHPLNPVDVNGINKMAAEKYHLLYSDVYGIHATALRLTNTIGPRMRIKDARQTFVGLWIRQLLERKPIEVWGGKQLARLHGRGRCRGRLSPGGRERLNEGPGLQSGRE